MISIHAARVGCDIFLSIFFTALIYYFNPRSPSGLRPTLILLYPLSYIISIHAARVGCDLSKRRVMHFMQSFQSTQPEWAATKHNFLYTSLITKFQSTQPEWAATLKFKLLKFVMVFQSTQPEWAATVPPAPPPAP